MSQESGENVTGNVEMSQESGENVTGNVEMSQETDNELKKEDWELFNKTVNPKKINKKFKRQQGIVKLIRQNPTITIEEMANLLDVNDRTIKRDIEELKNVIEHVGPTKGGTWRLIKMP